MQQKLQLKSEWDVNLYQKKFTPKTNIEVLRL